MDDPKKEIDSHANMILLGYHCFLFEWSDKFYTMNPLNYCLVSIKDVPIIDDNIAYDCPYSQKCYILL